MVIGISSGISNNCVILVEGFPHRRRGCKRNVFHMFSLVLGFV